jgi:hypothetical protein
MKNWATYIDGKYVGDVQAKDEQSARNAAISKFKPKIESDVSVIER